MLGVPKDLLKQSNGKIDPAWFKKKTTPGVQDLGGVVCPLVYRMAEASWFWLVASDYFRNPEFQNERRAGT